MNYGPSINIKFFFISFIILGQEGEKGMKGDTGDKGEKGDKGNAGSDGMTGKQKNIMYFPLYETI